MLTRSGFIASAAAFAISPSDVPPISEAPRLRLGALADLHVKGDAVLAKGRFRNSTEPFRKALRFFDRMQVDAVVCCGDLATSGLLPELERVGAAWDDVFPGNRRSDGGHVEKLFIYGDHDTGGYSWRESRGLMPDDELKCLTIPAVGPAAAWEKCFHEKWEPVMVKEVKGFRFVLAHHPVHSKESEWGNRIPGLEDVLSRMRRELSGERPLFYLQHRLLKNTVGGADAWGQDDGSARAALSALGNCIAFMGHGHLACTDERCVWQDGFTALEVPSLRYVCTLPGCENSTFIPGRKEAVEVAKATIAMPPFAERDGRQGLLVDVFDERIVVRRLDFAYSDGERVAPDWEVPLAAEIRKYRYAARTSSEIAPQFPKGASVAVRRVSAKTRAGTVVDALEVSFPPAHSTPSTPRANRYEVCAESASEKVVCMEVYSRKFHLAECFDGGAVKCVFPVTRLGRNPDEVKFTVRPIGAFGAKGKPIA